MPASPRFIPWYRSSLIIRIRENSFMKNLRVTRATLTLSIVLLSVIAAANFLTVQSGAAQTKGGASSITPQALRGWLSYISSDDLEGRNTFSEGLGLAAAYIADQIKQAGV